MFISGALLLLVAKRGEMQKRQILWLLLSTLLTGTLWFGQDYSLMFLMMCIAWACLDTDHDVTSAVLIGALIAMKPNFGLWPIMLFVAGYKKAAIVSAATAFGLSVLPIFFYGPTIYLQWLQADSRDRHFIYGSDLSIFSVFARQGLPRLGVSVVALCAIMLILFVRRTRPVQTDLAGIAICAGIICSPLAWNFYVLFAAPFFVAKRWHKLETLAAILIGMPMLFGGTADVKAPFYVTLHSLPLLIGLFLILGSFMKSSLTGNHEIRAQRLPSAAIPGTT
jgi:hypothetical protein